MPPDLQELPISALQHLLFCERQCALIHIEGLWAENRRTVEGRHLHKTAHDGPDETRAGVRIVRGLALRSERLGLVGVADIVEFPLASPSDDSTKLDGTAGGIVEFPIGPTAGSAKADSRADEHPRAPVPVEYKRGRTKSDDCDRVQLCAQALCLEEMLGVAVPEGALFYGRTRRRERVPLDAELRATTLRAIDRLREMIASGRTPIAKREKKCDQCSLLNLCLPDASARVRGASSYFERMLSSISTRDAPPGDPP